MNQSGVELQALAEFLNITPTTVHRWLNRYSEYVSPKTDKTRRGKPRILDMHTTRVLFFIETMRTTGDSPDTIAEKLQEYKSNNWQDFPDAPAELFNPPEDMPLIRADQAASMAQTVGENVFLQQEVTRLKNALAAETTKVTELQAELTQLQTDSASSAESLHKTQIELEQSKAEIARLQGQLEQYSFGRERPINAAVIVVVAMVAAAVLVVLVFVAARLLL